MNNLLPPQDKPAIYSVSQLNRATKLLLSDHFLTIQVEGEISNISTPSSGHIYFSLKDAQAQIRCAMFRSYRRRLNFNPENGNQVLVSAQVSLYEARGDYQLIVEDMQEAGDGALRRAFEALKFKLSQEGLFSEQHKQGLPKIPNAIAVISSATGAAVRDILAVIKRRFPALPVYIYPITVQGETAKFDIVSAIQTANARNEVEVIILARGGGSLEDLWAFNEEMVARAIFASKIPIISGVGHEVDFTIADFVADLRAATPTAAAEHATPNQQEWLRLLAQFEKRLNQQIQRILTKNKEKLNWLDTRLQQQHPGKQLQAKSQYLDSLELRLKNAQHHLMQQLKSRLEALSAKHGQFHPADKIKQLILQQQHLSQRLRTAQRHILQQKQQTLAQYSQTLHAVSPLATLSRGYSIVTRTGQSEIISNTETLQAGEKITNRLVNGRLISQIIDIKHD